MAATDSSRLLKWGRWWPAAWGRNSLRRRWTRWSRTPTLMRTVNFEECVRTMTSKWYFLAPRSLRICVSKASVNYYFSSRPGVKSCICMFSVCLGCPSTNYQNSIFFHSIRSNMAKVFSPTKSFLVRHLACNSCKQEWPWFILHLSPKAVGKGVY